MSSDLNLMKIYDLSKNENLFIDQLQLWSLIPEEGDYKCPKCEKTDGIIQLNRKRLAMVLSKQNISEKTSC